MYKIPFNRPYMTGNEHVYISQCYKHSQFAGDGIFTRKCHSWLEARTQCCASFLTNSCTAALEMAALLLDIKPGDEVIMPSFTFVSTANAFVLRGAIPVFIDIRQDTLNLDEKLIELAITHKTKAIVPVHYAGVGCEMDAILQIASKYNLKVVEDAAQGVMASYKGRTLGSIGDLGAYSFHETKNVISGEGGVLLVNDPVYIKPAEIYREKGTNRSQFFRGEVDKYTWQNMGSSFLPGELISAFLWAQLEEAENITQIRLSAWKVYHTILSKLENKELIRLPIIPKECQHNAHMYYIILSKKFDRQKILQKMKNAGVNSLFHYVPLHSSPAGLKYGRSHSPMTWTNDLSERIIRLPLWVGITQDEQCYIGELLESLFNSY